MISITKRISFFMAALALTACSGGQSSDGANKPTATTLTAVEFIDKVNQETAELNRENGAAYWVNATYITHDTSLLAAKATEKGLEFQSRIVDESRKYDGADMDADTARQMKLITAGTTLPAPSKKEDQAELAKITTEMGDLYGSAKYCRDDGECLAETDLIRIMAESREPAELLDVWTGWRTISPPLRSMYQRFAILGNDGAREMGYEDLGDLWRGGYDMDSEDFAAEIERLWGQVEPLYNELHCYTRGKLSEKYGSDVVSIDGPIPAHLLGNMWAQQWGNIYDLVEPFPGVGQFDVDAALVEQDWSPVKMTETAENFFVSMGMPELPDTFWERSLLTKPRDRDVVCHASAWPLDNGNDVRIKQCIEQTEDSLVTLHHELGHIYYFMMYRGQPILFQAGANDGFHEGIGDTLQLSMTPGYLRELGLVGETESGEQAMINQLMKLALDKIAFLPFGKLIDQWRWKVFSGEITTDNYNQAWWDLRKRYQGIVPPVERTEADFDPGAKYHIPGNTPYTRYFLAHILQFQFHRALCDAAGNEGPLYNCSIYNNKEAGERLMAMLKLGASKPWPDALEQITGTRQLDASAIIDYFAPLTGWLKAQNEGQTCGW
ncbi:MAG: M2 family metallopeptidase [Gammaproteobacteria bacterium]|nr:M2 family metallopeptidase [Gammaproteobacteria bacterium]